MKMYEAAETVLRNEGKALPVKNIYEAIVAEDLFRFGAKSPVSVLSTTLRDHSVGGRSRAEPIFERTAPGTYRLFNPKDPKDD